MFQTKTERFIVLVLFVTIGALLLLKQCNEPKPSDSVLNQRKDTSWTEKEYIPYEVIKLVSVNKPIHDTIFELPDDTFKDSLLFTREYSDSISDSNQTIFYNAKVFGILDRLSIKYRLKIPVKIKEYREIHDTKFLPNKWSLGINSSIGGNLNTFNMYIGADIRIKKAVVGYNYGLLNKTHNIKIGYILYNSKK